MPRQSRPSPAERLAAADLEPEYYAALAAGLPAAIYAYAAAHPYQTETPDRLRFYQPERTLWYEPENLYGLELAKSPAGPDRQSSDPQLKTGQTALDCRLRRLWNVRPAGPGSASCRRSPRR